MIFSTKYGLQKLVNTYWELNRAQLDPDGKAEWHTRNYKSLSLQIPNLYFKPEDPESQGTLSRMSPRPLGDLFILAGVLGVQVAALLAVDQGTVSRWKAELPLVSFAAVLSANGLKETEIQTMLKDKADNLNIKVKAKKLPGICKKREDALIILAAILSAENIAPQDIQNELQIEAETLQVYQEETKEFEKVMQIWRKPEGRNAEPFRTYNYVREHEINNYVK